MQTKIIKLQNGTDLIANVTSIGDVYVLEEPMEFGIEVRGSQTGNLIMNHWLPVQLIKKNVIEIQSKDIMSFMDPEENFCEYYVNTVIKIKELLQAKNLVDSFTDEEINNIMDELEDLNHHGYTLH